MLYSTSIGRGLGVALVLSACAGGCVGVIGDDEGPGAGESADALCQSAPAPGPSPLRRLTRDEYARTIRDLLGLEVIVDAIPPDLAIYGFDNDAAGQSTSPDHVAAYLELSEQLAADTDVAGMLPCDPSVMGERPCARELVSELGLRAWRRPLADDELSELMALYDLGAEQGGLEMGLRTVVERLLQSPFFLYRVEIGGTPVDAEGVVALSPYEIASRLSYFLWGTMPDDELFAAADSGALAERAEVERQARRMLDDPRAERIVDDFHRQWLWLTRLDDLTKSAEAFPAFSPDLVPSFEQETLRFARDVALEGGHARALFTADHTYLDQTLASFYGLEASDLGDEPERVSLAEVPERGGIMTQAALLTALAKPAGTHPVLRGKFVREQMFCQHLEPPADVPMDNVDDLDMHNQPQCASCHALLDPIGFSLERYDGIGRYRETDAEGEPIDATGELASTDVPDAYEGAAGLSQRLAESDAVMRCMTRQWFRYAAGRKDEDADTCSVDAAYRRFEQSGWDVRELIVGLTLTDAFLYRSQENQ